MPGHGPAVTRDVIDHVLARPAHGRRPHGQSAAPAELRHPRRRLKQPAGRPPAAGPATSGEREHRHGPCAGRPAGPPRPRPIKTSRESK